ncbi:SDR family NAD(P)-dependent oxidoreductase [Acidisphaera rubrifaciens]|uniref:Short-chain dehydrogenase/reductase SDR n=1 Tax=Acidisphaera rubrifaciens HS-AP3 TaxID=1231350 RepID=A0A0D6P764_9PROT|nr:SDR family NAD(P)-dependent oxidoreductase [Acidisphaera rubrifaciens]GAN77527.1 short-chain dehydrogenase/reductase SDR [Acidisphaera rubrifaciens HS-AP3]
MTQPESDGAPPSLRSFDPGGVAVVFGATGGIGAALLAALEKAGHFRHVTGYGRRGTPSFDLTDETSIARVVADAAALGEIRLAVDATGFLHAADKRPEKSWAELDAARLAHAFAVNAIGPALLIKHLLPRLPRTGKSVFATLSARVGSIGDNRLGGWYAYRASKAALNQFVRTASIELARRAPAAACVALHPGTVATGLSAPFVRPGREVHAPEEAARHLLSVIDRLDASATGDFLDWRGDPVPW